MSLLKLSKVLRGNQKHAVQTVIDALGGRLAVRMGEKVLAGDAAIEGEGLPIQFQDFVVGTVHGSPAQPLQQLVQHLYDKELEKRSLADETLGRYKELTLLYEQSETLSKLLDPAQIGRAVVLGVRKHLGATGISLLMYDEHKNILEELASLHDSRPLQAYVADRGVMGRVIRTGRAEFIENVQDTETELVDATSATSLIVAPLRSGERVFGVLRVTQDGTGRPWTAGELKLVTAMAAQAASALSNAQLHADQIRDLAMRHKVQRHLSGRLFPAVFDGDQQRRPRRVAVLFCDLKKLPDPNAKPEEMLEQIDHGVTIALSSILQGGGVVDIPQGDLVVGAFVAEDPRDDVTLRAVEAALRLREALSDQRIAHRSVPSVGVAAAYVQSGEPTPFFEAINAAANLQSRARERVVLTEDVASSLSGIRVRPLDDTHDSPVRAYEVTP